MIKAIVVNPPVYDFTLYDFWLKPYGALRVYNFLKSSGKVDVSFFDFLDRYSPYVDSYGFRFKDEFGKGKFIGVEVEKPQILSFVRRKFKRFGIPLEYYVRLIKGFKPEFVLIYTGMTYWYPGVKEVIEATRNILANEVKIITGGVLSTLLPEFVKELGADNVISGEAFNPLSEIFDIKYRSDMAILPSWSLYGYLPYIVIRLTEGCPFRCPYCASYLLKPVFRILDIERVLREVERWTEKGVKNVAFYDDALLVRKKDAFIPFLEKVIERGIKANFHTPNALHARFIDMDTAILMKRAGFKTIYLGFETSDESKQRELGGKVYTNEFDRAVGNLLKAGFERKNITAYIFMGLPEMSIDEVENALYHVNSLGIKAMLSEYSPIPGTPLGDRTIKEYNIDDLLLTNCSVFPLISMGYEAVQYLKHLKNRLNASVNE